LTQTNNSAFRARHVLQLLTAGFGTERRFAVLRKFRRGRSEADIRQGLREKQLVALGKRIAGYTRPVTNPAAQ